MKRKNVLRMAMAAAVVFAGVLGGAYSVQAGFVLPDSGQTNCYAADGTQISCPGNGQDGDYVGPQPAYQDNGDGTITDLNTGLMWMPVTNVSYNQSSAISYCSSTVFGNYTDWRLPTVAERRTIVDYGRANPALNSNYFNFDSVFDSSTWDWTVDGQINNPNNAWRVDQASGRISASTVGYGSKVRCVRSYQ